jgi:hypothetical protein
MKYEHCVQKPLPRRHFINRLVLHAAWGGVAIAASDLLGTLGYHHFAGFNWVDSFLNASMLLGGMGPVGELPNDSAKVFAALFALYSGLVFILLAGLMLAPVFHRVLHHFHWEEK